MSADKEIMRIEREINALRREVSALEKRTTMLEREVDVIRNGVKTITNYLETISKQMNTQLRISQNTLKQTKDIKDYFKEFRENDFPSYQRNLILALAIMDTTIIGAILGAEKLREKARREALERFNEYISKEVKYARDAYRQQLETIMKDYLNFVDDMFTQFVKMVEGELHLFEKLTLVLRDVQEFYELLEPESVDTEVYKLALELDFERRMRVFRDLTVSLQDINSKIAEASLSSRKILLELNSRSIEIPGLDKDKVIYLPAIMLEVELGYDKHTFFLDSRLDTDKPTTL